MLIPYGRQSLTVEDLDAVHRVLKSDFLTQGPKVPEFEAKVAQFVGAKHGIATTNATSALHVACLALGLGQGDVLWTSAITFAASANCARYCGADVDFVDIDSKTYNMSPVALQEKLERAERDGKLPKIVVPVHLCGQSCDMKSIAKLAQRYGFKVLEDASHAIGGRYGSQNVGSCEYSDMAVFSFHPVKIITTGEGGMILTNSEELASHSMRLRCHGMIYGEDVMLDPENEEIWNYQQAELGFNYRMTDLQAGLGLSQMDRLEFFVKRRHEMAKVYDEQLESLDYVTPFQEDWAYSSYHLYPILLPSSLKQREVYESLRRKGILVNLHYAPVYLHPYYRKLGFERGYCPKAEAYFRSCLSLPLFPDLSSEQHTYIVKALKELL
jgi:UDP-4-amino-4,6-dideoxy-N-acetyl-beta-L-altrosamine transaminase